MAQDRVRTLSSRCGNADGLERRSARIAAFFAEVAGVVVGQAHNVEARVAVMLRIPRG